MLTSTIYKGAASRRHRPGQARIQLNHSVPAPAQGCAASDHCCAGLPWPGGPGGCSPAGGVQAEEGTPTASSAFPVLYGQS